MKGSDQGILSHQEEQVASFLCLYEGGAFKSETGAIFLQPLGADHATMPHMKGI